MSRRSGGIKNVPRWVVVRPEIFLNISDDLCALTYYERTNVKQYVTHTDTTFRRT